MAIVINGSGTVTGLAVGGLPDGTVDAGTLATDSVDSAELVDGSIDTAHIAADQITSAILPAGSVLQVVNVATATQLSGTNMNTQTFNFEASITPSSTSSKILMFGSINGMQNGGIGRLENKFAWNTTSGGTTGAEIKKQAVAQDTTETSGVSSLSSSFLFHPNTTSTVYVKSIIEKHDNSATWYVNRYSASSTITLMEIAG
jgi:hypothetical protein